VSRVIVNQNVYKDQADNAPEYAEDHDDCWGSDPDGFPLKRGDVQGRYWPFGASGKPCPDCGKPVTR
jgi:hypothetical protein